MAHQTPRLTAKMARRSEPVLDGQRKCGVLDSVFSLTVSAVGAGTAAIEANSIAASIGIT